MQIPIEGTERSSLTQDLTKGITEITYNHLNLPAKVTFDSGDYIAYTYTAAGEKIKKLVKVDDTIKEVDYLDGFQYAGGILQFFPHAEGYVKATVTNRGSNPRYAFDYVYNYTDHLGNIRPSYTKDPKTGQLRILEENHYYPFGLKHEVYTPPTSKGLIKDDDNPGNTQVSIIRETEYMYKYNGKELQDELDLNWYDFHARNYDPALGRWMNPDPLAEKFMSVSPYNYALNNPVVFVDPDGMEVKRIPGDFVNEKGQKIGSDGKVDGKVYVIKTTKKEFDSGVTSAGITEKQATETENFIKENSGNTEAFQNNSIAYDNSVEIEGSKENRESMVQIVEKDNGLGGESEANNREYGGQLSNNGVVTESPPGKISNPKLDSGGGISHVLNEDVKSTFHSHPSGFIIDGKNKYSFHQPPSIGKKLGGDVNPNRAPMINYVFARGEGIVYIYHTNKGVLATIPHENFVNFK